MDIEIEGKVGKKLLEIDRFMRKILMLKVSKLYYKTRKGKFEVRD